MMLAAECELIQEKEVIQQHFGAPGQLDYHYLMKFSMQSTSTYLNGNPLESSLG